MKLYSLRTFLPNRYREPLNQLSIISYRIIVTVVTVAVRVKLMESQAPLTTYYICDPGQVT